jgi:hypothetical protein
MRLFQLFFCVVLPSTSKLGSLRLTLSAFTKKGKPPESLCVRQKMKKEKKDQYFFLHMLAGPTGIEPATPGLKVRCSSLTELRTRTISVVADRKIRRGFLAFRLKRDKKGMLCNCVGSEDCCHEASDSILRVENDLNRSCSFFRKSVDSFPLNPDSLH